MKAIVEMFGGRYEVTGVRKVHNQSGLPNEKPTYEIVVLHSFCGKSYKTKENAIKAIQKKGMEYIDADTIRIVAGWD